VLEHPILNTPVCKSTTSSRDGSFGRLCCSSWVCHFSRWSRDLARWFVRRWGAQETLVLLQPPVVLLYIAVRAGAGWLVGRVESHGDQISARADLKSGDGGVTLDNHSDYKTLRKNSRSIFRSQFLHLMCLVHMSVYELKVYAASRDLNNDNQSQVSCRNQARRSPLHRQGILT